MRRSEGRLKWLLLAMAKILLAIGVLPIVFLYADALYLRQESRSLLDLMGGFYRDTRQAFAMASWKLAAAVALTTCWLAAFILLLIRHRFVQPPDTRADLPAPTPRGASLRRWATAFLFFGLLPVGVDFYFGLGMSPVHLLMEDPFLVFSLPGTWYLVVAHSVTAVAGVFVCLAFVRGRLWAKCTVVGVSALNGLWTLAVLTCLVIEAGTADFRGMFAGVAIAGFAYSFLVLVPYTIASAVLFLLAVTAPPARKTAA